VKSMRTSETACNTQDGLSALDLHE
jgi:hypothetical protein